MEMARMEEESPGPQLIDEIHEYDDKLVDDENYNEEKRRGIEKMEFEKERLSV